MALLITFLTILPTAPMQKAEAAPPANFQTNQIIGSGLNGPSGFELAPDGRIFILERAGKIKIFKNGQLLAEPFTDLPSAATGDRGLIGIAFDPEFDTNHYVYFYYTGLDLLNRLVRFDASNDVATSGAHILYQTTFPSQQLHVGGSIRFGLDGKLYFAVGDNGYPPNAQDLSNPHGKILRINKNGTVPLDNPFYGQPGKLPEIWAYGFRNPWRFQFDNQTGKLYGGDVGDFTIEEVNHIEKGKNYGWPICEGECQEPNITSPIYDYPHAGQGSAVTGGPIYRNNMFPPEYNGSLFFADYARGFIKRLTLDENGNSTGVHDFDLAAGSVVDLKTAPDGSMYYITYYPGRLYRVTYSTGNQIPVASAGADDTKGIEPHTVNFTSAGSFDPENNPLTYLWDFGDGTTSTQANPTKTYTIKGTYIVELTVSDASNSSQAAPIVIQVGTPPTITIGEPANNSNYNAGDTIHYTAFAQDGAGFDINDANISTEVLFHHNTHTHPFLGPIIGRQGTFTIPTTGEAAADTYFEIKATATDDNGLQSTAIVNVYPNKKNLNLGTNVTGAKIFLDGVPTVTNQVIQSVVGFTREVSAPLLQIVNGILYQFDYWSDGGFIKHFVTIPSADTEITAYFTQAPAFNAQYFNNIDLSGAPVLTRQDNMIDFVWGDNSPAVQVNTDFFSVRWTKDQYFKAGKYKFTIAADDGVRLYIDNNLVVDQWQNQAASFEHTQDLTEGNHNIRFEYYEAQGGAVAILNWDLTPDQPQNAGVYTANYFNNTTLTGAPVYSNQETVINHDWGQGSPNAAVGNDFFSARWTKIDTFEAKNYEFTVTADDGIRLFIDGQKVLDKWVDQAATTYKVNKVLTAGPHQIMLEYYEKTGGASAVLNYVQTDVVPPQGNAYTAQYWNTPGAAQSPQIPQTAPTYQTTTSAIDFVWDAASPHASINNDHFVARYTKTDEFEAGTYTFTASTDDGVRVFVDNNLVIDAWNDHATTTYTQDIFLTAGTHEIKVEYYENAGGAVAIFNYQKQAEPIQNPYSAQFWNMGLGSSPQIPNTAPTLTRTDNTIDFSWQDGSPAPTISAENFTARWTKQQDFSTGTYKFTTLSDDGIRVYVDNDLVIDQWNDHAETIGDTNVAIEAGVHTIKVEYYENGGGATAKFNYTKISNVTTQPEIFSAQYFNNVNLSGTATLTRNDKNVAFNWGLGSPDSQIPTNGFSARFIKSKTFSTGQHKFTITADDGVRVYIDNILIINQWADHNSETFTNTISLVEGVHEIKIEYFENTGSAVLNFLHEVL